MTPLELTYLAYRKLKQFVHYENNDLFTRLRLAQFETNENFNQKMQLISEVAFSENPAMSKIFVGWLKEIDFRIVPKKFSAKPERAKADGLFISNVSDIKDYELEKVNYFFDGPIELHLVSVLWLMSAGVVIDGSLSSNCRGVRLHSTASYSKGNSLGLIRKYHELYSGWRDDALKVAKEELAVKKRSTYILGLDIKEYFYRIRFDYKKMYKFIKKESGLLLEDLDWGNKLSVCLDLIGEAYRKKIHRCLKATHPDLKKTDIGLPIGLCSSSVLANWYLNDFDKAIVEKVSPAYYGRYVDDILIVIPSDSVFDVESFVDHFFVKKGLFVNKDKKYEITTNKGLFLQKEKCILQYFDAAGSIAGLEKFKKKLEENASNFSLLSAEETDSSLEDVAYDLLYDGSVNKFRSVKGLIENRFEVSKHLARQISLYLYAKKRLKPSKQVNDKKSVKEILKFFKGSNSIKFYDLWEKVFTLLHVSIYPEAVLEKQIKKAISKVNYQGSLAVTNRLKYFLLRHLRISKQMTEALKRCGSSASKDVLALREANLMRHHLIPFPLINYTKYRGALTSINFNRDDLKLDAKKTRFSPRYIRFDECCMFAAMIRGSEASESAINFAQELYKNFNGRSENQVGFPSNVIQISPLNPDLHSRIRVALCNCYVDHDEVALSYCGQPAITIKRLRQLHHLLNDIVRWQKKHPHSYVQRKNIDLIVFPEVCIPYSWAPILVNWARKHQVGIICGLEHKVDHQKNALNEILTVLPFKNDSNINSCIPIFRLKKFYSPKEKSDLKKKGLKIPEEEGWKPEDYHLIQWRGVSFTVYNCYELTNLSDRAKFKGSVDFVVCAELNPDINYFSAIVESTARDLHCFVMQVNSSEYGDSRIVSPAETRKMNPLRVTGGDNNTFLTMELDLKALRKFQVKKYVPKLPGNNKDNGFKPIPPGFDLSKVFSRVSMGFES